jgi:predicted nucleic acid-binding protein
MSVTLDTNVLVYASNADDPVHERARELVGRLAEGPEIAYLFWPVLLGYLRLVTHPAILPAPLSPAIAVPDAHVAALMRQHGVRVIYTRDRDFRQFDGIEPRDPFET